MFSSLFSSAFTARRPHQPASQGATPAWCPLKTTPTRRPVPQAFSVEGRQSENAERKKKTMKTKSNSKTKKPETPGLLNRTAEGLEGRAMLPLDFAQRTKNRGLSTEALLNLIRGEAPQLWEIAEVVGKWVWVQFEEKQPPQITLVLSQLGFHWNNKRQLWQHPCGTITEASLYDPRRKYRSYFPADQKAA